MTKPPGSRGWGDGLPPGYISLSEICFTIVTNTNRCPTHPTDDGHPCPPRPPWPWPRGANDTRQALASTAHSSKGKHRDRRPPPASISASAHQHQRISASAHQRISASANQRNPCHIERKAPWPPPSPSTGNSSKPVRPPSSSSLSPIPITPSPSQTSLSPPPIPPPPPQAGPAGRRRHPPQPSRAAPYTASSIVASSTVSVSIPPHSRLPRTCKVPSTASPAMLPTTPITQSATSSPLTPRGPPLSMPRSPKAICASGKQPPSTSPLANRWPFTTSHSKTCRWTPARAL